MLLLPDGWWKSILLILAPAITVAISSSWYMITDEINVRVADWRIRNQRRRAEQLLKILNESTTTSNELKQQAQKNLEALALLEVEISKKRVDAIVAS